MHIPIKCSGSRLMPWQDLQEFQGNLKDLSTVNYDKLKKLILTMGWIAPFFVCNDNQVLDGHGRLRVLKKLISEGHTIDDIPVVDVQVDSQRDAARKLLAIDSRFQAITEQGLYEFVHVKQLDFENIKEAYDLPGIDFDHFKASYIDDLDFAPEGVEGQGKLDEKKKIVCPECQHEFTE